MERNMDRMERIIIMRMAAALLRTAAGVAAGLLACLAVSLAAGCRSAGVAESTNDSVRVEVRTRTEYVPDIVYVEIPAQTAERTTADSASHLENDYAVSDARINADGTLFHRLGTKPQERPVGIQKPVVTNESIEVRYKTRTRTVEVERELGWWERFKMDTGAAFMSATAALALFLLYLLFSRRK